MKINYLLPTSWKPIGWFIFTVGVILSMIFMFTTDAPVFFDAKVLYLVNDELFGEDNKYFGIMENNILDEIAMVLTIIGGLIVSFAKLKEEDEYINKIRMESLIWAFYVNYFILFFCIALFYDLTFFWILVYNVFTPLIIFMIRFHWIIWRTKKQGQDEE